MSQEEKKKLYDKIKTEEKKQENFMTKMVEEYKLKNPEKYKVSQDIGNYIMSQNIANKKEFIDENKNKEKYNDLVKIKTYYGEEYLNDEEKKFIASFKG